ncbi:MAG: winged helix-turn-helix domain-containing protein [Candidatus Bathyarchaeia archaeon]
MQPQKIFAALSSGTRIEIIKILAVKSKTVREVLDQLNLRGFQIKYRESVYRALEKLAAAGLVEKYYDNRERDIRYRIVRSKIDFDFHSGEIT